jgi:glycosyltransferase involved in cell wall biosynthesis
MSQNDKVKNENGPIVSIGMPVYNGQWFIKEAVESILDQTFENFELIISDNASTDNTENICNYYKKKDPRVKYYRSRKNFGAAWNYNHVYKLSKGKYFKWAAHDDLCEPTFFEKCVNKLDINKLIALCYPKTLIIDEKSNILKKDNKKLHLMEKRPYERFKHYLTKTSGECNAIFGVIRSSLLNKTSLIQNYMGSDIILLCQLSMLGMFYEVEEELFFRRDHPNTSVRANPNHSKVTEWFDSKKVEKIVFPNWRWLREYVQSIFQSEILITEKIHCTINLIWWYRKKIKLLRRDLIKGAKQYFERDKII